MLNPNVSAKLSETCGSGTQITCDAGAIDQIPSLIGDRQYCVLTCGEPFFAAPTDTLAGNSHPPVIVIDDVAPNPDFALLAKQAARFASLPVQPEVIVALGGSSVIDTAKVLASANGDLADVETFLVSKTGEENLTAIPIIAVPTTADTDVICWATVWDNSSKKKYSLNRPALSPEHAVIDPALMLGKSRALTISTGLDALSHAPESIWNVSASEASARCAVNAAQEILEVLLKSMVEDVSLCGRSLKQIFGDDLSTAPRQMTDFLTSLGVSTHPKDHGVSPEEWVGFVDEAFMGERGLNFIGTRENYHQAAQVLGVA